MKKIIQLLLFLGIFGYGLYKKDFIITRVADFLDNEPKVQIQKNNEYAKDENYLYVQKTDDYVPYSYHELINVFYSFLDNGWDDFTFYCPDEYKECLQDVVNISNDNTLLTNINNYVHPYNSFFTIKTAYNELGEVTVSVSKLYTDDEIVKVNNKVDLIIKQLIKDDMETYEKIKVVHDYIVQHTIYDQVKNETGNSKYKSNTAYGVLIQGYGLCGGYTDAMALFLERFDINNYKIASKEHVWNALYFNNKWIHLDVTWDDQIDSSTGKELLRHQFLLIDSVNLKNLDIETDNHDFDKNIYLEYK